jgi:hypothetical protein
MKTLTNCPVCNHAISPKADNCPACGHPIKHDTNRGIFLLKIILIIVIVFMIGDSIYKVIRNSEQADAAERTLEGK